MPQLLQSPHRRRSQRARTFHTIYDGDGKRIKKYVPSTGETTVFVYDAGGKQIAEYSTILTNSTDAKVAYLTSDHLGSPRINTDADGKVISRHDYHPFGEEVSTSERMATLGYAGDTVRKQFTGYERDQEIDLDYAVNRYHSPHLGRFTQADPYNILLEKEKGKDDEEKQKIFLFYVSQPQIWNKYAYALDNPLNISDPDGRRQMTAIEQENLRRFRESGYAFSYEKLKDGSWTMEQAEAFRYSVDAASQAIENAILASPNAANDPAGLKAVLYGIGKIGDSQFTLSGSTHYQASGTNVALGSGSLKCTFFIGVAYAKGARIGWSYSGYVLTGKASGYPLADTLLKSRVPVANEIIDNGLANFVQTSSPSLGDLAVGKGQIINGEQHPGHAGLVILGEVVLSANENAGVRAGAFSPTSSLNGGFKYFTYKP